MPEHIILKLSRYFENSTNNMIPTQRNILFRRIKSDCCVRVRISASLFVAASTIGR